MVLVCIDKVYKIIYGSRLHDNSELASILACFFGYVKDHELSEYGLDVYKMDGLLTG